MASSPNAAHAANEMEIADRAERAEPLPATVPKLAITPIEPEPASAAHEAVKAAARSVLELEPERAYGMLLQGLDTLDTDDREYLALLGVSALSSGRFGEARVVYKHLVVRDPSDPRWWTGIAVATEQLGERNEGAIGA